MNHQQRIELTASKLAVRLPFIATLFSGMKREIAHVGTACVKGMHVKFDPDFMDCRDNEELLFVAAHEALHPAFLHSYRLDGRDPELWNVAGDAVINLELAAAGLIMPKWNEKDFDRYPEARKEYKVGDKMGVLLPWVKPEMDTETVYKRLLQEREQEKKEGKGGKGDKDGRKGGWGNQGDLEQADGSEETADSEAEVKVLVSQAARTAFASGDKSELIKKIIGVVKQADVDWKEEMRAMLQDSSRDDYSYRRFSKRFICQDLYMPSLYSECMGTLGVGVDTSGSMTQRQLDQIQAELRVIVEDCAPQRVIVVYCDSRINSVETFEKGDELVLKMQGGGGTDMRKIIDYFSGVEERLAGVVIFSDLYTPFPKDEPEYPLLWGAVGAERGAQAPVGKTVEVRV